MPSRIEIRKILANLSASAETLKLLAQDASLNLARISFGGPLEIVADSVLDEAERDGKLVQLLTVIRKRYPDNPDVPRIHYPIQIPSTPPHEVRADLIQRFSDYCNRCAEMLDRTSSVYTVQTPATLSGDYKEPFKKYMEKTAEKIVTPSGSSGGLTSYQRLISVDQFTLVEESTKIDTFFSELESALNRCQDKDPNLDCLVIGIVHRDAFAKVYTSNLDTHITDHEVALALQKAHASPRTSPNSWHACVYACVDTSRLREVFERVMELSNVCTQHRFESHSPELPLPQRLKHFQARVKHTLQEVAQGATLRTQDSDSSERVRAYAFQKAAKGTLAHTNLFFSEATHVPSNRMRPLVQWFHVTRSFALMCPTFIAKVAHFCESPRNLPTRENREHALQILAGISSGEFGVGMPYSNKVHYHLFREMLSKSLGMIGDDELYEERSRWPETEAVVRSLRKLFKTIPSGVGVMCLIEQTALGIIEAMQKVIGPSEHMYLVLHMDVERRHSEEASRAAALLVLPKEDPRVFSSIQELGKVLGAFWNRMARELWGTSPQMSSERSV